MINKTIFLSIAFLIAFSTVFSSDEKTSPSGWYTKGRQIVKPNGEPIQLTSVSWFGFETQNHVVHGLWSRNMEEMLDQIKSIGFNSLRLPYSNDILKPDTMPDSINFHANPKLEGKTALEIFDLLISEAANRELYIILDRHRPTSAQQSELWYTPEVSEEQWIKDWTFLAERYKNNQYVIAVDLHNEPHGFTRWGNGNPSTDWKAAAEKAGNAILNSNPSLLIIVEGIELGKDNSNYWWGGTLDSIRELPVQLNIPNKVVYSPHDYGPNVFHQRWFDDSEFPTNLYELWNKKWGYIADEELAPIWIGEFGGRETGFDTTEGIWQQTLVQYIKEKGISYSYWSWNPNSGDTGGMLFDDWTSINEEKVKMLFP